MNKTTSTVLSENYSGEATFNYLCFRVRKTLDELCKEDFFSCSGRPQCKAQGRSGLPLPVTGIYLDVPP